MPDARAILQDPNYLNANPATKQAIFNRYVSADPAYASATPATQAAIRARYGLEAPAAAPAAKPAAPAAPSARPMLPGAGQYTGLDAVVMAPFSGPKMQAFQAGMGQSIGSMLALGGDIVGGGVGLINPTAGRNINNFVQTYRNVLAAETQPVMAGHPVSSLAGEAATYAIPGTVMAKSVGGAAKAASGTARAVGATRAATAIERAAAPVVTGLETGGFRTGMIPTKAAIAAGEAVAPRVATRLADLAVRGGTGAATGAVTAAAVNPEDMATGALFGALIPTVGAKAANVVGNTLRNAYDVFKGTAGGARAADLFRQAAGADLAEVIRVLRDAPDGVTVRQALEDAKLSSANIDAIMALGETVEKGAGAPVFGRLAEGANAARENVLASAAGGATASEARTAAEANRSNLNAMMRPEQEQALSQANIGGQIIPPLEAEVAAQRALAAQRAAEARQLGPLAERTAADRQVFGGISPLEQPEVTQEFLNRAGAMAGRAEQGLNRAAEGSVAAGEAARKAESKIAELRAAGIEVLDHKPIVKRLTTLATQAGDRADPVRTGAFTSLAEALRDLAKINSGVLDARDLYQVRKTAVNDTIANLLKDTGVVGKAAKERTAHLLNEINPLIDQAIEDAGGKGWTDYLKTYASGAREIERQQMAARALEIYRADPAKYVELLKGMKESDLEAVEEVFGPGSFDFVKQMAADEGAPSRLPAMQEVGRQVTRDADITKAAGRGADAANALLSGEGGLSSKTVRTLARWITPKAAYTGELINALTEQHIAPQIQTALVEGFRSGKSAVELIAQLPSRDRAAAARALSNPRFWSATTVGGVTAAVRPPNTMAPPAPDNRNAMAR